MVRNINKTIITLLVMIFLIGIVSAEQQTLGTFKVNDNINLIQSCDNSTYSNITRIVYPNSTFALNTPTIMTKQGDDYNYTYKKTSIIGDYLVYGNCDESGVTTNWVYDFEINPAGGLENNTTIFIILILVSASLLVISLWKENALFSLFSGFAFGIAGAYSMIYGFSSVTTQFTRMISVVIIGLGLILTIISSLEFLKESSQEEEQYYYSEEDDD